PPYPNPTRGAVHLRFQLPSKGRYRLAVLNSLGQVAALFEKEVPGLGWEEVVWEGPEGGGLYFVRLLWTDGRRSVFSTQSFLRLE
ncbi:MAG: hypothetical protein D6765_14635, partial [Bacteroidetes bacterium]